MVFPIIVKLIIYQNIYTVVHLARKQNKIQSRGCWNNFPLSIKFQKASLFRSFGLAIVNKTKENLVAALWKYFSPNLSVRKCLN